VLSLAVLFVYILLEISFNARVASVAGFASLNTDNLRSLELLGRSVSGLGAALLLTDTFLSRSRVKGLLIRLLATLMIVVIAFSGMFFGQKILVDSLIDASSAQLRHQAVRAQALRGAIAEGVVELQDEAQALIDTRNADAKIFMTLFPAASTMNTSLKEQIDNRLEDISGVYEAKLAAIIFEAGYPKYDTARDSLIDEVYPRYIEASTRYVEERESIPKNAKRLSRAVKPKIEQAWGSFKNLRREAANKAAKSSAGKKIIDGYENALNMESKCRSISQSKKSEREGCFSKVDNALRVTLKKNGLKESESRNTIWWVEQKTYGGFFSSMNVDGVRLLLMQPGEFTKASGGYPPDIQTYKDFYAQRATANQVRDALEKEGISGADGWKTTTSKNIVADMERYLDLSLRSGWKEGLAKAGVEKNIDPDLDFKEFVKAAGIEEELRKKLNISKGETVSLRMNKRDFYRKIAEPEAERMAAKINRILQAPPEKFSDGEIYESEGKRAVRATYVPPIVMILSLTMVMISSLKILAGVVPRKRIGRIGKVVIAMLVCWGVATLPFFLRPASSSIGAAMDLDSGYSDSVHPLIVTAVRWLVHTQPQIYPLGEAVDSTLHVGEGFKKHIEPYAAEIDHILKL
jgi:hypothetical protein